MKDDTNKYWSLEDNALSESKRRDFFPTSNDKKSLPFLEIDIKYAKKLVQHKLDILLAFNVIVETNKKLKFFSNNELIELKNNCLEHDNSKLNFDEFCLYRNKNYIYDKDADKDIISKIKEKHSLNPENAHHILSPFYKTKVHFGEWLCDIFANSFEQGYSVFNFLNNTKLAYNGDLDDVWKVGLSIFNDKEKKEAKTFIIEFSNLIKQKTYLVEEN